jgi:hypothetical protein
VNFTPFTYTTHKDIALMELTAPSGIAFKPTQWLQQAWQADKALTLTGVAMLLALALTLIGIAVDPRIVTGQPVWLKPAKFAISLSIYCFSFIWLLGFITGLQRVKAALSWVTVGVIWVEFIIIAGQAWRGTTSHFNNLTPLDLTLFNIMGAAIATAWLMLLIVGVFLAFQKLPDRALLWSLRWGVFVSLIGMAVAVLMLLPSAEQLAILTEGGQPASIGGHSVGVADGGAGLPIVGWSTEGGDIRIPHFFGLHGLQVIPFLAFALGWLGVEMNKRIRLVWLGGAAYTAYIGLLTWQALRDQSIIAPDALSLMSFGALFALTALLAAVIFFIPQSTPEQAA